MEILFNLMSILQSVSISLGVGCSTLAIVNFFVAIADGTIDASERKMMDVVYIVLRVAMMLILLTSGYVTVFGDSQGMILVSTWALIAILYLNAILMSKHIMPSKVGPALQAATWYTLGITFALVPLKLADFTLWQFIFSYIVAVVLAVVVVNVSMSYIKNRQ